VIAGLAGTVAASVAAKAVAAERPRSKVVRVESAAVWKGEQRDPELVREMVHEGLVALTGEKTPEAAWKAVLQPGTKVGLKINLLGRPRVYTAPEITDVVAAGALLAGVRPQDLTIWDRYADHFRHTSYVLGPHVSGGTIRSGGTYDAERRADTGYGPASIDTLALATQVTINLPVLKDHNNAGITGALKNIAFGCYQHPERAHDECCEPYIVDAYSHFLRHNQVPLAILDATKACYERGPNPADPRHLWRENAVYLARDPVALDQVHMQRIMAKRQEMGVPDKSAMCRHNATAAARGLGTNDPARIDLVVIHL
jgi:uncharacterized protein (DUF362 family)